MDSYLKEKTISNMRPRQYQLFQQLKKPKRIKTAISIVSLVLLLVIVCFLALNYLPQGGAGNELVVSIKKGDSLDDISGRLQKQGIIRSGFLFNSLAFLEGVEGKLKAGKYLLSPEMSISEILDKLKRGDRIKETITVLEGWSLKDIAEHFKQKGLISSEEEFFAVLDSEHLYLFQDFEFLKEKPQGTSLEGYFFPDTYEIVEGEAIGDILKKMLENFSKKISPELQSEINKQAKTLEQVLTMASILEKEIKSYEDRQLVAGLLWKRMKNGWPLQVDAGLTYILGKGTFELTKEDLQIDSRYNTYRYYGLPPTPICSPGLESIKAAVYYKDSPYWFYLTTPEGDTVFSKTLWEHNENRQKYLR